VIVETKIVGETSSPDVHEVIVGDGSITLRHLLEILVSHELTAYEQRRASSRTLRVLTPSDIARGAETGRFGREARGVPAAPSLDVALDRATEAFGDGLYLVFLDDTQVEDLDAALTIGSDSRLRLVRLVALAGG
jgi:hypothetical protein